MDKIIVEGGVPLSGSIRVQGSKNSALPILFATLLTEEPCTIRNVPDLSDVDTTMSILRELGMGCERDGDSASLHIETDNPDCHTAGYELVSTMRASICTLGPLLARRGRAKVSLPGGCVFGAGGDEGGRPIDLHLMGLEALGARINLRKGYIEADAPRLRGNTIDLSGPNGSTVTGTANILMAATLAEGRTVIKNAAFEPEVTDLARFLNKMGACIEGMETSTLTIEGVQELRGVDYEVMPDRIEAGTYLIAGAVTRGNISVEGVQPAQLEALTDTLEQAGVLLEIGENKIQVSTNGSIRPVNVATLPYPGFPTDLQAPLTVLLTQADGTSQIIENVYKDRFMHVPELNRLGANIRQNDNHVTLSGPSNLSGADVMASDLRAGASLLLAGLAAKDRTVIHRVYHIDRGYEQIEEKLAGVGAIIWRDDKGEEPPPETKATRIPVHQV